MLRRAWKPLAATTVIAGSAGSYYYYYYYKNRQKQETISISVQSKRSHSYREIKFPLVSKADVDARLVEHATFHSHRGSSGITWNHTTASVASNDPIEDASAAQIIARDETDPSAPGDLAFFAVLDGHSGFHTSRLLAKILIKTVASQLYLLVNDPKKVVPEPGMLSRLMSVIRTPALVAHDADPKRVSMVIQNTFTALDHELINAPVRILASNVEWPITKDMHIPDLSKHPLGLPSMQVALSGSCAIMALLDSAHRNLYVACTGDARAVAGIWEQGTDGLGYWRVDVLSEDQTGDNPNEIKRMRSEHPADERSSVVQNGRVIGGLQPSRAFGDARYKWPRKTQEALNEAFMVGSDEEMRAPPHALKTPPYVTATPVVTHRKLDFSSDSNSSIRFLVLATDGLWDELTSEEVVALVGGHFAGLKGTIPDEELHELVPTEVTGPIMEAPYRLRNSWDRSWVFEDENVSAHIIRNAFNGDDDYEIRRLFSIPAPHARQYRDDITVTVVWWEVGREDEAHISTANPSKAKL